MGYMDLMVVIRNRLSSLRAGGPRQLSELRDRFIVSVGSRDELDEVRSELDELGLDAQSLDVAPVLTAEPQEMVEDTLDRALDGAREVRDGISDIENARDAGEELIDATAEVAQATALLRQRLAQIGPIRNIQFVLTEADYGPENLRVSPNEMDTISPDDIEDEAQTLEGLNKELGLRDAWEVTRGENATVVIFDTGFAPDLISNGRLAGTFSGEGVDGPFAPAEGHGTMTAGAAAASKEDGLPFNGAAPGADVALVRITDKEGQIRQDIIANGWDWVMDQNFGGPAVVNHSYGTPLCSGRPKQKFCDSPMIDVIKAANSRAGITSVYAAGNEAMRCGHRPSGITSAITGTNSIPEVITVGALRFDGAEAQRYSSHGRGDCAPISSPKPEISCALPMLTYYGAEDGWEIKDMGMGIGGSSGGTSHASPTMAGMIALIQSAAAGNPGQPSGAEVTSNVFSEGALQTEELKQILKNNAEPPHRTQVNQIGFLFSEKGYDARFGHGQVDINSALDEVV